MSTENKSDNEFSSVEKKLIKELVSDGREKGFVTIDEINESLGDETPSPKQLEKLLQLPDAVFQAFDPFTLEKSDPDLFQSLMLLLSEEIPIHDFGLSLLRMKERNLEIEYQEWLLHCKSNEERAQAALKRRVEEKNLKEIMQIIDNVLTQ